MRLCVFITQRLEKFRAVGILLTFLSQATELDLWNPDSCIVISSKNPNSGDIEYTCKRLGIPVLCINAHAFEGMEDYKGHCLELLFESDTVLYQTGTKDVFMQTNAKALQKAVIELDFSSPDFKFTSDDLATLFRAVQASL